jgi:hypothetical protein
MIKVNRTKGDNRSRAGQQGSRQARAAEPKEKPGQGGQQGACVGEVKSV